MPDDLTQLERQVIATLLAPDHPVMDALRRQVDECKVTSREFTGHGFFSALAVPVGVEPAPVTRHQLHLGQVFAAIEGLERVAGFVLFVREGVLDMLEGFAHGEPWPDVLGRFEINPDGVAYFQGDGETDLEQVEAAWDRSG